MPDTVKHVAIAEEGFVDNNDAAKAAIDRLLAEMVAMWNRHDARAYAAIFADDADFTNVFGMSMHGRAAVERAHAAIFKTMFRDSILAITAAAVRFLRPDVASVDVRWRMVGARDPQGHEWPERYGLLSAVATETPDGWSFAVFHNQDLPPPERVAEIMKLLA